ncbi:MAG: DUF4280 domain-containing protein [Opitutaceae bacterium]|nr:DUF4280 domain-containing protein [Opitutaceae bacterium]
MNLIVVDTAETLCAMGTAPAKLKVTSQNTVYLHNLAVATVMDHNGMMNVMPHGMCLSLANPAVAAATSAAAGVLTPQPCQPVVTAPWTPGASLTYLDNKRVLQDKCVCNCMWAGVITILNPGQSTTFVD